MLELQVENKALARANHQRREIGLWNLRKPVNAAERKVYYLSRLLTLRMWNGVRICTKWTDFVAKRVKLRPVRGG